MSILKEEEAPTRVFPFVSLSEGIESLPHDRRLCAVCGDRHIRRTDSFKTDSEATAREILCLIPRGAWHKGYRIIIGSCYTCHDALASLFAKTSLTSEVNRDDLVLTFNQKPLVED